MHKQGKEFLLTPLLHYVNKCENRQREISMWKKIKTLFSKRADKPDTHKMLARLQKLKAEDPNFEKAIQDFADAEAQLSPKDDPCEGKPYIVPKKNGL